MSLYDPDIDFTHAPTDEKDWQESVDIAFYDDETGLCGFLRIGSEPNIGTSQVHFVLGTRDGLRYRRNLCDLPMEPHHRTAEGFAAGTIRWTIPNGEYVHITANDPEATVDFKVYDFFKSTPWPPMIGAAHSLETSAPNHFQSSGKLVGRATIGARTFDIRNGLVQRIHSFGKRDVSTVRAFRWIGGTFGPDFSFNTISMFAQGGVSGQCGYIHRNGVYEYAKEVDSVAFLNADGLTIRGGILDITLESGEKLHITAELVDGLLTAYRQDLGMRGSPVGVEGISIVRCGDRKGFCDFNVGNAFQGVNAPLEAVCDWGATIQTGISQRQSERRILPL